MLHVARPVVAALAPAVLALVATAQDRFPVRPAAFPFACERQPSGDASPLVRALSAEDPLRRRAAAHELLHRRAHVDAALGVFLATADLSGDVLAEHVVAFAGTAFCDVARAQLAALSGDARQDDVRARVFALADRARLGPEHQRRLLDEYVAYAAGDGQRAVDVLRRLRAQDAPPHVVLAPHVPSITRTTDAELDLAIESCALRALADPAPGEHVAARTIDAVAAALRGSEPPYSGVVARLAELATRAGDVREAAFAASCDAAPSERDVVRRCVELVDALPADAPRVFTRVVEPRVLLPRVPQRETNAALDRLAARARDLAGAGACLALTRTFDVETSPLAARVFAACAGSSRALEYGDWDALVAADTGWELGTSDADAPAVRVCKALVDARTRRARGMSADVDEHALLAAFAAASADEVFSGSSGPNDPYEVFVHGAARSGFTTPALVDRALELALEREVWSSDFRGLARWLANAAFTPAQDLRLLRLARAGPRLGFESLDDARAFTALLARRGHAVSPAAARVRAFAYAEDDVTIVADLLALDTPAESDLAWLAARITDGSALQRAAAVRLIARHALDTPALRARTSLACADVDAFVAAAARELCADRGW